MGITTGLPPWQLLDLKLFDYLSTFRHPPLPDDAPIIVAIDEPSMAEINLQWPWPRGLHARLIAQLRAAGTRAIGLDIIFAEPSTPENDAALTRVLGDDVVLAGDEALVTAPQADQFVRTEPLPQFTQASAKTGIASINLGRDGIFREIPRYPDGFAAQLAHAAGISLRVPQERRLTQVIGPARTYRTVSYYQALDPQAMLPPGLFKDRIVIVGLSLQNATSIRSAAGDAFATSYTVHTGKLVAGAEIQATIFDNLRHELSIGNPGRWGSLLMLTLAAVLAAFLCMRPLDWRSTFAIVLPLLAFVAISAVVLWFGRVFISPAGAIAAYPIIFLLQAALDYAEVRRNRQQIIRAFSRYLSPALVKRLADDPSHLRLGGERRTLSILFCDVRGFTTISEQLKDSPEELTALINRLLTPLSDIVLKESGTIDKYIGDCLMAFWNAPLNDPDHAAHAVSSALQMLDAVEYLNAELAMEAHGKGTSAPVLRIGIGINTGECVVGNMGSVQRFDYSVLGDSVNLASRLEGQSKSYGIPLLIGERTAIAVSERFNVVELDRIQVKGRTEFSPVYGVVRAAVSDAERAQHERFLAARYDRQTLPDVGSAAVAELRPYYEMLTAVQDPGPRQGIGT
jgi:adenylate cyclase